MYKDEPDFLMGQLLLIIKEVIKALLGFRGSKNGSKTPYRDAEEPTEPAGATASPLVAGKKFPDKIENPASRP